MKNFELFIDEVVSKWRSEKKYILKSAGLGMPSNRENGDLAEDYILCKIDKVKPNYKGFKSKGSQTPADIYSVARRNGYWHIMLIQVKSSTDKKRIYKLTDNDKKAFNELAKFVKSQLVISEYMTNYKKSAVIISNGYASVFRNEKGQKVKHHLIETKTFKVYKKNTSALNIDEIKKKIIIAHQL